ncbi:MAG: hypothetical protein WD378_06675 [Egicoccus sp.]
MITATRSAHSVPATPAQRRVPTLAIVDLVLAAALFAVAVLDPFSLSNGARWAIVGVGDVALLFAVVTVVRTRRAGAGSVGRR